MKLTKAIVLVTLLISGFALIAQTERPVTIKKLKELIGQSAASIESTLKKKGYDLGEKTDVDGYHHEYFADKNYIGAIEIIYVDKVSQAAGFEGISETEYKELLKGMEANGFILKTKGSSGIERQDIWETKDEAWRLVAEYKTIPAFKPLRIMLSKQTLPK